MKKDADGEWENQLVRRTGRSIASFGEDSDGEVYLLSFDGRIYRIVPTDEPENFLEDWPVRLSETGIFDDVKRKKMNADYIQYQVNAPFWSDQAQKERFIKLPAGTAMAWREHGAWQMPVGTEVVKNFLDPSGKRMLETRLIKRIETGWEAATYVWHWKGKEAQLVSQGKQFEVRSKLKGASNASVRTWHAPSSSECNSCHVDAAGYVLGINTAQLNDVDGSKNQLRKFSHIGMLEGLPENFVAADAPRFCDPHDATCDLETRARVVLDVNCAMCHRPDGPGNAKIDLRYNTPLDQTMAIGQPPAQGDMGIADAKIIAPAHPDKSLLLHRMGTLGSGRMPNIGSQLVDEKAVEILRQWIASLVP